MQLKSAKIARIICTSNGLKTKDAFYPVVFESYGAFGSRARDFIRLLNDEASINGIHKLQGLSVTNFVNRSLAVMLQVANSVICKCQSSAKESGVVGVVL